MKDYSLGRNLTYMAMAFYRPRSLINRFLDESSLLYGIVPLAILVGLYEFLYLLDYLSQAPVLAKILPIPDSQYRLCQILFAPFVNAADFLLFGVVIYGLSKLLRYRKVSTGKVVCFLMFAWGTFGLLAVAVDSLSLVWASPVLMLVHPVTGVIAVAYTVEFTHQQAGISRWKSLALCTPAATVFLLVRSMFFR